MKKKKEYIRVGDTVQLIFTDEIGVVVDIFDGETMLVELEGEEIPVFIEHLKKVAEPNSDSPASTSNTSKLPFTSKSTPRKKRITKADLQKKKVEQERKKEEAAKKINAQGLQNQIDKAPDRGLQVALQPFYDESGDITYFLIHLINDTGYALQFEYELSTVEKIEFVLKKKIGGREVMILNSMNYDTLNDQPFLYFTFEVLKKDAEHLLKKFEKTVKPKAKMLRRPPISFEKIGGKAYLYPIFHQIPLSPKAEKQPKPEKKYLEKLKFHTFEDELKEEDFSERVYVNAEERIIDLHIDKLVKSYKHLPKRNILVLQLQECQKSIEEAIKRREKNMVVIHGIGKGKLKQEVFKLLREFKEIAHFKNEYNHRFGFGATEIFFDYSEE